ncbi:DUF6851 domain-containing protein [Streptomyces sp. NPDC052236]|uniref:DUF6851 domain-containing protein n=1 Tax=Streptomyces sp. NPDC052236 TaxID=3365686 RepID=UPI0037CFFFBF
MTIATAAALVGSLTSAVPASSQQAATFDLDRGNALLEVIYPRFDTVSRTESLGRLTLTVDRAMLIELPWFDALAAYHPKAVGIFSNLGRRPAEERTARNKNIAVLYSAFTSLNAILPEYKSRWLEMMAAAGLDPGNTKEDPATPSGIGILAAKNAMAARENDASNREGDEGGRKYNQEPYADYTGYKPVNSADELRNPSRWQPNVGSNTTSKEMAVFRAQQFATPQFGRMTPFSYRSPAQFEVSPPARSNHRNHKTYQRQADEVLKASASLTDRQKMTAEFFNDKVRTYGAVAVKVNVGGNYDTEKTVQYVTRSVMTLFDTTVATWHFKRKYDSVRPFSAIRHLYGKKNITAWAGPGKGTVSDITGDEWQSYLNSNAAANYPEYPSATSALCLAFAQQARRSFGDKVDISVPAAKGSSLVEPGVTPASDITLHWSNLTEFAGDCGESRVWGGENFPSSTKAAAQYAPQIGDLVYDLVQRKLNGG